MEMNEEMYIYIYTIYIYTIYIDIYTYNHIYIYIYYIHIYHAYITYAISIIYPFDPFWILLDPFGAY